MNHDDAVGSGFARDIGIEIGGTFWNLGVYGARCYL
jgi:hypothetical protein